MRRLPALGALCRRLIASDLPRVATPSLALRLIGTSESGFNSIAHCCEVASHASRTFSASTGLEPPSPVISTLSDFKALTDLSINTPIVVYATASADAEVDPELVRAVHASRGSVRLAQLDAGSAQLSRLTAQLHITNLPATLLLFGGRLMDSQPGAPSGQELRDYLAQIQKLADDVARHRAQQADAAASGGGTGPNATPAQLLEQGYAALQSADADVETAALPWFQQVLIEGSPASDAERCKALAGAAQCALLRTPCDVEAAAGLVEAAQQVLPEDKRPGEVAQAAAFLDLARERLALEEGTEASDPKGAEAAFRMAHKLLAERQYAEALDAGLKSVRADRGWHEEAGRKLLLRMFEALGAGHPAVKPARSRLSNIWFL
uniref:Thioredoxin domain-containing protein n=1 Tax=Auxenochlorella protothecoides TaxID=3075 RepID=A0A1D2A7E4_AUXPR